LRGKRGVAPVGELVAAVGELVAAVVEVVATVVEVVAPVVEGVAAVGEVVIAVVEVVAAVVEVVGTVVEVVVVVGVENLSQMAGRRVVQGVSTHNPSIVPLFITWTHSPLPAGADGAQALNVSVSPSLSGSIGAFHSNMFF